MITDNLKTTYTKAILQKLGVNPDDLPDNLITTHLKAILENIGNASGGGGMGGADWNAAEGEPGHVLNRTHYTETKMGVVLEETSPMAIGTGQFLIDSALPLTVGKEYTVTYNGVDYVCTAQLLEDGGEQGVCVGNFAAVGGEDTGEPFVVAALPAQNMSMVMDLAGAESCTVKIVGEIEIVHKLDEKYLPDNIGNVVVVSSKIDTENNRMVSTMTPEEIHFVSANGKAVMFVETIDETYTIPLSYCYNDGEGYKAQFDGLRKDKDTGAWFYTSVFIDTDGTLTIGSGTTNISN